MESKVIQNYPTYAITNTGLIIDLRTGRSHTGHFSNGYRAHTLKNQTGNKTMLIHRLVAMHFLENPNNYNEIDHINRVKDDNRVENLRWANDFIQAQNKNCATNNILKQQYICKEQNSYRVQITRNKINILRKRFQTLEEAIKYRDDFLKTL